MTEAAGRPPRDERARRRLDALREVVSLPTAPLHEQRVAAYVRAALERLGLPIRRDRFGNLIAEYSRGERQPPVALVAHMDHPAFELTSVDGARAEARLLTTDKVLAILFPVSAFVVAGFEHSVANMYFIPLGLLIKHAAPAALLAQLATPPADLDLLTWPMFLSSLVPVTIGNIIGGAVLVGAVYWFVYLRHPAA